MRYTCKEVKKARVAGRQREELTYNAVLTKNSDNPTSSSEASRALQSCLKLAQEYEA